MKGGDGALCLPIAPVLVVGLKKLLCRLRGLVIWMLSREGVAERLEEDF